MAAGTINGITTFETTVKRKSGERKVWRVCRSVYVGTKRKQVVGQGATERDAWAAYEQRWKEWLVKTGELPSSVLPQAEGSMRAFESVLDEWWELRRASLANPGTRNRYESALKHARQHFMGTPILAVTGQVVARFLTDELPKRAGSSTGKLVFLNLRLAFDYAVKKGYLLSNPMDGMRQPKVEREKHVDPGKLQWLPEALLDHLGMTPEAGYWVMAFVGLRQSERLGLQWSSFDNLTRRSKPCYVTIDRHLARNEGTGLGARVVRSTKSDASKRRFAIDGRVRELLIEVKRQQDAWRKLDAWVEPPEANKQGLVFTTPTGEPVSHQDDNDAWHDLFDRLDEEAEASGREAWPRVVGHTMRHIAATRLANQKVPPATVMKILGHSGEAMTLYYTHLQASQTREVMEEFGERLFSRAERSRIREATKKPLVDVEASEAVASEQMMHRGCVTAPEHD